MPAWGFSVTVWFDILIEDDAKTITTINKNHSPYLCSNILFVSQQKTTVFFINSKNIFFNILFSSIFLYLKDSILGSYSNHLIIESYDKKTNFLYQYFLEKKLFNNLYEMMSFMFHK